MKKTALSALAAFILLAGVAYFSIRPRDYAVEQEAPLTPMSAEEGSVKSESTTIRQTPVSANPPTATAPQRTVQPPSPTVSPSYTPTPVYSPPTPHPVQDSVRTIDACLAERQDALAPSSAKMQNILDEINALKNYSPGGLITEAQRQAIIANKQAELWPKYEQAKAENDAIKRQYPC